MVIHVSHPTTYVLVTLVKMEEPAIRILTTWRSTHAPVGLVSYVLFNQFFNENPGY